MSMENLIMVVISFSAMNALFTIVLFVASQWSCNASRKMLSDSLNRQMEAMRTLAGVSVSHVTGDMSMNDIAGRNISKEQVS